jgi:predicted phage baseplate assembly protein
MTLDTCGCKPDLEPPPALYNRPGLDQVAYRVGVHPSFMRRMLLALTAKGTDNALAGLTTREADDPAIGLLDAFAAVADVLTFYQERIANEGFLRTASERRSLLELARTIGYELAPGVSASAYLEFTVEDRSSPAPQPDPAQAPPAAAIVRAGTQVKSLPGQGELPQTFETSVDLAARGDWNALQPLLARAKDLDADDQELYLSGTTSALTVGDLMVIYDGSKPPAVKRVFDVTADRDHDRTLVTFADQPAAVLAPPKVEYSIGEMTLEPLLFTGTEIEDHIIHGIWSDDRLRAFTSIQRWQPRQLVRYAAAPTAPPPQLPSAAPGAYAFRLRAASFGHNAQAYQSLPASLRIGEWEQQDSSNSESWTFHDGPYKNNDWDADPPDVFHDSQKTTLSDNTDVVLLDSSYPKVVTDSWVLFVVDGDWTNGQPFRVSGVAERSTADYAMSAKVTAVELATHDGSSLPDPSNFLFRRTAIYGQSERLELAPVPLPDTVPAGTTTLELDRIVLDWPTGQPLAFTGERSDLAGVTDTDVVHLTAATHQGGTTTLEFEPLHFGFVRRTLTVSANVVDATHGETVKDEVLGSSDGSANQRFTLRKKPLTYVSSSDPGGAKSSLEVRVDGIRWQAVRSLYGLGPADRCYVVRRDDDGTVHVVFGDGEQGARPPSGTENVTATYRQGIGRPGLVDADKLTLLQTRPLGIRSVVNPSEATGAEDPEERDAARQNAPLTVLTLDRIVSLTDYEDFARAFAGIGKASAVELWRGDRHLVHVTVAGPDGAEVPGDSDTYRNLAGAIAAHQDPAQTVQLASFTRIYFDLVADVLVDPDHDGSAVVDAVKAALADRFSFVRRAFGQGVSEAEVIETVLSVEGTVDTFVSGLAQIVGSTPPAVPTKDDPLLVSLARFRPDGSGDIDPGQLLLLNPAGATITERSR